MKIKRKIYSKTRGLYDIFDSKQTPSTMSLIFWYLRFQSSETYTRTQRQKPVQLNPRQRTKDTVEIYLTPILIIIVVVEQNS